MEGKGIIMNIALDKEGNHASLSLFLLYPTTTGRKEEERTTMGKFFSVHCQTGEEANR